MCWSVWVTLKLGVKGNLQLLLTVLQKNKSTTYLGQSRKKENTFKLYQKVEEEEKREEEEDRKQPYLCRWNDLACKNPKTAKFKTVCQGLLGKAADKKLPLWTYFKRLR